MPQTPRKAGRTKRAQIAELEAELAELRAQLSMKSEQTIESWGEYLTQEMRDEFAARAIARSWGDVITALRRLNFTDIPPYGSKDLKALGDAVFGTAGVKTALALSFKDSDVAWNEIIERQRQIALRGEDAESVRAAAQIAKIEGRFREPAPPAIQQSISLAVLVNGQSAQVGVNGTALAPELPQSHDILEILSHEPGEPKRVDSHEESVYEALEG